MKKIIFMMCAILATTMMAKAEEECKSVDFPCGSTANTIYLTATPTVDATHPNRYGFVNWTNSQSQVVGTDKNLTITTISGADEYTAHFAENPTITITKCEGTGAKVNIASTDNTVDAEVNTAYYITKGQSVTLTATPPTDFEGCYKISWKNENGEEIGTNAIQTISAFNATASYSVEFTRDTYSVSVSAEGNGEVCISKTAPAQQ